MGFSKLTLERAEKGDVDGGTEWVKPQTQKGLGEIRRERKPVCVHACVRVCVSGAWGVVRRRLRIWG